MKTTKAVPVLMYHHVSPAPGLVTISPENFRAQIGWLARHGYTTIGCDDLAHFLAGAPLPPKSVLLTFDDGYLDNYVHAHPILAEFDLKAALFLITGQLGDGPARACAGAGAVPDTPSHDVCKEAVQAGRADQVMLRWSEVEKMRAAGTFEFHSHTHTHTRWDRVEADRTLRDARLAADLEQSRATLRKRLGQATPHLCWPQGYHDDGYVATARAAGFSMLYTTLPGTVARNTDPLRLPRIVTKETPGWLCGRLWIYHRPGIAAAYQFLRGKH